MHNSSTIAADQRYVMWSLVRWMNSAAIRCWLLCLLLSSCCGVIGCSSREGAEPAVPAIDAARFRSEFAASEQPVVVLFRDQKSESYRMRSLFLAAQTERADLAQFVTINADANASMMSKYGLKTSPSVAVFDRGELVVAVEGEVDEMTLSVWLDQAISLAMQQHRGLDAPPVVELTEANFDEFLAADETLVLVDFWATWCGPCLRVAPQVELVSMIHAGNLKVGKVDVDAAPKVSQRFDQGSVPFLVVFQHGKEIARRTGAPPGPVLRKWVADVIASTSVEASNTNKVGPAAATSSPVATPALGAPNSSKRSD